MTNDSARACEKVGYAEFTSEVDTADESPKMCRSRHKRR